MRLPLVGKLEEFLERGDEGGEFVPYKIGSLAEYIVCTWLVGEGGGRAWPLLGITHLDLDTYLVVLSDWKPFLLEVAPSPPSSLTPSSLLQPPSDDLITAVQHLLMSSSKPPLLKLPDRQINPRQWLELTLKLIQR